MAASPNHLLGSDYFLDVSKVQLIGFKKKKELFKSLLMFMHVVTVAVAVAEPWIEAW